MKRLVFDTSTACIAAGILTEKGWLSSIKHFEEKPQQSKLLFRVFEDLLKKENLRSDEITELAVGIGPGSYTGLRVGLTVAKVWAEAMKIPLYRFSSRDFWDRELKLEDFQRISDLIGLSPIYENDHFA